MTLQPESNRHAALQRMTWLYYPVVLLFLVLGARLWQLQIIRGPEYVERAERNRVRTIDVVAPRGTIFDRNNHPLVENRPSFNVLLYREAMSNRDATMAFVQDSLGVSPAEFESRMRRSRATGLYRPVVIKGDVGIEDISVVEAHRRDHPEIQLGPEPRRLYRYGNLAAHVLGYVGEVSEDELAQSDAGTTRPGDLVGKDGVERMYNLSLTGENGRRHVLVDSVGREVGALDSLDAVMGGELWLTIDLDLQMVAESMIAGKVGSLVAMDPRNGEILAMASSPSYDPNSFSARISEGEWNRLLMDPDKPLQNRSIHNAYPPGSIFKLIMAEAGLEEGFVDDETRVQCFGAARYYSRLFHCHQARGHGVVGLEAAIRSSCNIFFYELGKRMGISRISERASGLGLGHKSGIDLPGERSGVMPSPEWKQRVRNARWFAGETISVSIGQGAVTTTPIQLLRAVSAIATGGGLVTPHVFLRSEKDPSPYPDWHVGRVSMKQETAARIRDGMWASVNRGGTGHNAAIEGFDVCGKTGTVQVLGSDKRKEIRDDGDEFEDHSWFAGFASKDNPEIAVVVLLEHGGMGGLAAAPLAHEIFRIYYQKRMARQTLITQALTGAAEAVR